MAMSVCHRSPYKKSIELNPSDDDGDDDDDVPYMGTRSNRHVFYWLLFKLNYNAMRQVIK